MELTRKTAGSGWVVRRGLAVLTLGTSLVGGWPVQAQTATAGEPAATPAPARHLPRHRGAGGLEERVTMLSRALHLDARQQAELRKVLEGQREQVGRVWNDTSVPAADRVSATQAISDRTADQIRALLNEEQRKQYNQPRQRHTARPSVEAWMYPGRAK